MEDWVRVEFERQTEYGVFRDAICLPPDQTLSDAEIAALQEQRVQQWLAAVQNPPPEALVNG